MPLHVFERDFVLYRTEGGEPVLLDAFCPHLGAHLGHGGKVEGDDIRCPFHAWKFGKDGACSEIPYTEKIPPKAKIRCNQIDERNGMIFAWHDDEGAAPEWEVPDLPEALDAALALHRLPPSALMLELTENAAMVRSPREERVLDTLAQMGVRLVIDDFGTGHSSLTRLKQLPLSELKIDRAFVLDYTRNPEDAVIVETSVRLAHSLALDVVAEGIEDADTWARLKALGCDFGQGFLIGRPMPLAELESWLAGPSSRPVGVPAGPAD